MSIGRTQASTRGEGSVRKAGRVPAGLRAVKQAGGQGRLAGGCVLGSGRARIGSGSGREPALAQLEVRRLSTGCYALNTGSPCAKGARRSGS